MAQVRESALVALSPPESAELWTDTRRWPTFIEGFAHVVEQDPEWPQAGSKLVWQSIPSGRGRVTERVTGWVPPSGGQGMLSTRVFEQSMTGVQTVTFDDEQEGTLVQIELQYELQPTSLARRGALGRITDLLFIRRALGDSLARTLRRFATEAAEEGAL